MNNEIDRDLGPQPICEILEKHGLKAHDLVTASTEQITHKMVARACKGRRLSVRVKLKILKALNNACEIQYNIRDIFNY